MNIEACLKAFKTEAAHQRFCQHPECEDPGNWHWEAHHVTTEAHIRDYYSHSPPVVWDPRNSLRLCRDCHLGRHHNRKSPVPLKALRDENYEFAVELMGAGRAYEYLRRVYSGEDPRLDALIACNLGEGTS